jgi:hypothetical protein
LCTGLATATRSLPLSEVNEAFRLIEDREIFGKVVLKA